MLVVAHSAGLFPPVSLNGVNEVTTAVPPLWRALSPNWSDMACLPVQQRMLAGHPVVDDERDSRAAHNRAICLPMLTVSLLICVAYTALLCTVVKEAILVCLCVWSSSCGYHPQKQIPTAVP